jgi:probable dihydroxyacetone kinase regulator
MKKQKEYSQMAESILTKKAIVRSLKELANEKPFDKISIGDIAERCGINRQTFYYHFHDKFELLSWIYYNELFLPNMEGLSFDNWDERLMAMLIAMKEEQKFYVNTIKHAEYYVRQYFVQNAELVFEDAIKILDDKNKVNAEERQVFSRFFAYGLCGTILEWSESGMKEAPENLSRHMRSLLDSCEKAAYNRMLELQGI